MTDVVPGPALLASHRARVAAIVFAGLAVVHLLAQLTGVQVVADPSQWLLMPALAVVLWCTTAAPRSRLVRLVLVALGFSWVGDALPDLFTGDAAFLAMVGGFLCAQIVYSVAFWRFRHESVLRRPPMLTIYVALAVVLVGLCLPGADGVLAAAVVVYGVCLVAMAVLATGVHRIAGIGGLVFLFSDAMIALGAFTDWFDPPASGFWVMVTYVVGQVLLVAGVLYREADAQA